MPIRFKNRERAAPTPCLPPRDERIGENRAQNITFQRFSQLKTINLLGLLLIKENDCFIIVENIIRNPEIPYSDCAQPRGSWDLGGLEERPRYPV